MNERDYDKAPLPLKSHEQFRAEFDEQFRQYGTGLVEYAANIDVRFGELAAHTIDTMTSSGKRLRPYLCYLGFNGFGGVDERRIQGTMMAMEIYHSALLVHDDVMDGDLIRHGVPNVGGRYMNETNDENTSRSMAILSGDLLAGLTFGSLLYDECLQDSEKIALTKEIVKLNGLVCAGQQLDALLNITPIEEVTEDHIQKLYTYKTALYTYDAPLRLGATLAGADERAKEALANYAKNMGIAFQITDDVMGVFASSDVTGKPKGTDVREGKKTLLAINAYKYGSSTTKALLGSSLGNQELNSEVLELLCEHLVNEGILEQTEAAALHHINLAKEFLNTAGMTQSSTVILNELADKLVGRKV